MTMQYWEDPYQQTTPVLPPTTEELQGQWSELGYGAPKYLTNPRLDPAQNYGVVEEKPQEKSWGEFFSRPWMIFTPSAYKGTGEIVDRINENPAGFAGDVAGNVWQAGRQNPVISKPIEIIDTAADAIGGVVSTVADVASNWDQWMPLIVISMMED